MKSPTRAHSIHITAGADTIEDLIYLLKQVIGDVQLGCRFVSAGGYSGNYRYEYDVDSEMTHEKYMHDLDTYLGILNKEER